MKIILLSDANSIHTQRWVESIYKHGFKVQLFSLFKPKKDLISKYREYDIKVTSLDLKQKIKELREPNISKIKYLQSIPLLKRMIKNFNPDIVHAHYSSSYGLLGLMSGFRPLITSVWGSDIYYFPYKNIFNKWLTKLIINYSDKICSTSVAMKQLIEREYRRFDIEVISFGIDLDLFKPSYKSKKKITVGTIKSIENHNGIDCFIDAAKIIIRDYKKDISFIIVGEGSLKEKMQQRASNLKIENKIKFIGFVNHQNVIEYYNDISIFIAVSTRESFGVAVLEAAACEIPSITSNIGGLVEVNLHNETGIVIEPNNPEKLAESILMLYEDENLRSKLGKNARKRVVENYNWEKNVSQMINLYKSYKNK